VQRRLHARFGERGQLALCRLDLGEAEDVARRDAQELATLEPAETLAPILPARSPPERPERFLDQLVTRLLARQRFVVAERLDEVGPPAQRVAWASVPRP